LQKTVIILIFLSVVACAPVRYSGERTPVSEESSIESIIEKVRKNNLSEESFFIEKGTVTLEIDKISTRYLFSLKYNKPDKYLLSIKNAAGIEGARVFISKDTILINDRIGKRLLVGKPGDIEKISGFPFYLIDGIFGDLALKEGRASGDAVKVLNSVLITRGYYGKAYKSLLDPTIGKVSSTSIINTIGKEEITLSYSKFSKSDKRVPGIVELRLVKRNAYAKIRIEKYQTRWEGEIEFIPGKGFTKEEIK
jgi:hypothetical protein